MKLLRRGRPGLWEHAFGPSSRAIAWARARFPNFAELKKKRKGKHAWSDFLQKSVLWDLDPVNQEQNRIWRSWNKNNLGNFKPKNDQRRRFYTHIFYSAPVLRVGPDGIDHSGSTTELEKWELFLWLYLKAEKPAEPLRLAVAPVKIIVPWPEQYISMIQGIRKNFDITKLFYKYKNTHLVSAFFH